MPVPEKMHIFEMKPGDSIVWRGDEGSKQTVGALPDGSGFVVKTESGGPFSDPSDPRVVTTLEIAGFFGTNIDGEAGMFRISSQLEYLNKCLGFMNEQFGPGPGYALVGRKVASGQDGSQLTAEAETYALFPGEGVLFTGTAEIPNEPIKFQQSNVKQVLKDTDSSTIQLMALVDQESGGLLLTNPVQRGSYSIGRPVPKAARAMATNYGRFTFTSIWGESPDEVNAQSAELKN